MSGVGTLVLGKPGQRRDWDVVFRIGICVVTIVAFAIVTPHFISTNNSFTVLQTVAFSGIAALGVGVTMIAGEFDLSIGSMAVLGSVCAIKLQDAGMAVAIIVPVLGGALVGAIQGGIISALRISSLVLTIGTLILFSGLAYILSGETSISLVNFEISLSLSQRYWILSPVSALFLVLTTATWIFLRYSRYGRELYAIGGARREAEAAGVRTLRPLTLAFAFSGATGALTGVVVSLTSGGATPTGFSDLLLSAVAAAVVGGVALSGGRGSAWGIALGSLALAVIVTGIDVLGAPFYVNQFVIGGLLLAVLAIEMIGDRLRIRAAFARAPAPGDAAPAAPPQVPA
jgi:ribose transport system permease protein